MPSRCLKALQGGCSNFFGASCGLRRRSIVDVEAMVLMMMVVIVVMYRSPVSFQFPRRRALTGSGLANRRPAPEPRAAQIRAPWRPVPNRRVRGRDSLRGSRVPNRRFMGLESPEPAPTKDIDSGADRRISGAPKTVRRSGPRRCGSMPSRESCCI